MHGLLQSKQRKSSHSSIQNSQSYSNVILFSPGKGKGITLSYPSIALHALGSFETQTAVYLQLNLHNAELTNSDDDVETLDLHLIPVETASSEGLNPSKALYDALSACADLHPDPNSDSEPEDTTPGAGGWITSENMHEFTDADGNFIEGGSLGAGAGTIRAREEEADEDDADGNGVDGETKWQRTG
jgi:nucleotide-sensitive chloride channel 1A